MIQGNTISYTSTANDPSQDFGCDYEDGSGIDIYSVTSQPAEIIGNVIENNRAQCYGGGIQIGYGASPIIEDNVISNNVSLGYGGAISLINGGQPSLIQNIIAGNNSGAAGGALYLSVPSGGSNYSTGPVLLFIENNTLVGNTITPNPDLVEGDAWVDGSAIAFPGYVSQAGLYNNIIEADDSHAAIACFPVYQYLSGTPPVVDHNDIVNTGGARFGGWCPDQNGTNGNISSDPNFFNPGGGDFHLKVGSPAIDSGNNAIPSLPSLDFDSKPRIQNATHQPFPIIDMGVYEAPGSANLQSTQISLSAQPTQVNYGANVSFQATVAAPSAITSGDVGFFDGTTLLGQSNPGPSGNASFSTSTLNAGVHVITAAFSGNSSLAGSVSSTTNLVVNGEPTSVSLSASPAQPMYPQSIVLTATVQSPDGNPGGNVTFYMGDEPMASVPLNSQNTASYTFSNLGHGQYGFYATYPIQGPFASSTSPSISVFLQPAPTTVSLSASPNPAGANQAVTFVATVQSSTITPTGSVFFNDGQSPLGTAGLDSSGVATFVATSVAPGLHTISASYVSNDGNFAQSTSPSVSLTVNPPAPDFSVSSAASNLDVTAGQSASDGLTITPTGSYTGSISFSCSGLPASASCSFSPSSLNATGSNNALTTTLGISVAASGAIPSQRSPWRWPKTRLPASVCIVLIAAIFMMRMRFRGIRVLWKKQALGVLVCVGAALAFSSCGGSPSNNASPPPSPISATYTVVVTASGQNASGVTAHSLSLTVVITQ